MRKTVAFVVACVAVFAVLPAFAQGVKLKPTPFPDGTGSIGVAPGWSFDSASKGGVTCTGKDGAIMILQLPYTILRPESSVAQLPGSERVAMASSGDIVGALRSVMSKIGATLGQVRGRKLGNLPTGAPTYLLLYQCRYGNKDFTGIGYFASLEYGYDQPSWSLYSSSAVTPTAQFTKQLPLILAMWKSWRPSGNKPAEGSAGAVFDEILKKKNASFEEIQKQFREQL